MSFMMANASNHPDFNSCTPSHMINCWRGDFNSDGIQSSLLIKNIKDIFTPSDSIQSMLKRLQSWHKTFDLESITIPIEKSKEEGLGQKGSNTQIVDPPIPPKQPHC